MILLLLLCSHSPNDVPPEPQRNVSIAAVRGAMCPSSNDDFRIKDGLFCPSALFIHTYVNRVYQ